MTAYYNEHDPYAAEWLRRLILNGHIAPGDVDERDIRDIRPDDLKGYAQCHFFAGIGVWSHALRRAGWADDRPIWTGSCPCQPFSAAGARAGFADERHLWPAFRWLINQCKPPIVIGEQVASKDGLGWLDLVSADMEASGYAFGASDLCAAGFGGAHIRQRLYFAGVGDAANQPRKRDAGSLSRTQTPVDGTGFAFDGSIPKRSEHASSGVGGMDDHQHGRRQKGNGIAGQAARRDDAGAGAVVRLGNSEQPRLEGHAGHGDRGHEPGRIGANSARPVAAAGCVGGVDDTAGARHAGARHAGAQQDAEGDPRNEARLRVLGAGCGPDALDDGRRTRAPMLGRHHVDWLFCRDGKWRPVEPGAFPLVDAAPARVGRLRAYGNALDAETATRFLEAVMASL